MNRIGNIKTGVRTLIFICKLIAREAIVGWTSFLLVFAYNMALLLVPIFIIITLVGVTTSITQVYPLPILIGIIIIIPISRIFIALIITIVEGIYSIRDGFLYVWETYTPPHTYKVEKPWVDKNISPSYLHVKVSKWNLYAHLVSISTLIITLNISHFQIWSAASGSALNDFLKILYIVPEVGAIAVIVNQYMSSLTNEPVLFLISIWLPAIAHAIPVKNQIDFYRMKNREYIRNIESKPIGEVIFRGTLYASIMLVFVAFVLAFVGI